MKRMAIVLIYLCLCGTISQILPDIGRMLNITGGVAGIVITVVLPVLIYNKAFQKSITTKRIIFNYFILIFCTLLSGLTLMAEVKFMFFG